MNSNLPTCNFTINGNGYYVKDNNIALKAIGYTTDMAGNFIGAIIFGILSLIFCYVSYRFYNGENNMSVGSIIMYVLTFSIVYNFVNRVYMFFHKKNLLYAIKNEGTEECIQRSS